MLENIFTISALRVKVANPEIPLLPVENAWTYVFEVPLLAKQSNKQSNSNIT